MDTTPFPILDLPNVALRNCLWNLDLTDLMLFSDCSDRCKAKTQSLNINAKHLIFKNKELFVTAEDYLYAGQIIWDDIADSLGVTDFVLSLFRNTREFRAFLEPKEFGGRIHFSIDFRWSRYGIFTETEDVLNREEAEKAIEMYVNQDKLSMEMASFNIGVPRNFIFSGDFIFKKQPSELLIFNGSWFSLKNLLQCGCTIVEILNSSLTDRELNTFLEIWKSQQEPSLNHLMGLRIERLKSRSEPFYQSIIIQGLDVVKNEDDVERTFNGLNDNFVTVYGGWEIQRADGISASFKTTNDFGGYHNFQFCVGERLR